MFQITRRADYAIRMLLAAAAQPERKWLPAGRIAEEMDVPRPFLHKITADLVRTGLVRTRFGRSGGLALARPAEEISLKDILEAIDGPVCLSPCLVDPTECTRDYQVCATHRAFGQLQAVLVNEMRQITLARLAADEKALRAALVETPAPPRWLQLVPVQPNVENVAAD